MGKGFQNFMSKKDFHPSAWWNLKKVWEAKEKMKLSEQKEEEMRVQYEKEQEIMNNKALLGDEKAKLGLSFMYDAPTGMAKREEPKEEPKFEWQRKYNAPREEWAKGNDAIVDQPFGIQVRNVRCVKCHTWGHLNTDRECPLYNMSGNAENPGYANNPSDLLKEFRAEKEEDKKTSKDDDDSSESEGEYLEVKAAPVDQVQLLADMKEDHGFNFKQNILHNIRSDDVLKTLGEDKDEAGGMEAFLKGIKPSRRRAILARVFGKESKEYKSEEARHKSEKEAKKAAKKEKKSKRSRKESDSDDEQSTRVAKRSKRSRKESDSDDERYARTAKRSRRSRKESDSDDERSVRAAKKSRSRKESDSDDQRSKRSRKDYRSSRSSRDDRRRR